MRPRQRGGLQAGFVLILMISGGPASSQDVGFQDGSELLRKMDEIRGMDGRRIRSIQFEPRTSFPRQQILSYMRSQEGAGLDLRLVQEDMKLLFRRLRLRTLEVAARVVSENEVDLIFRVEELQAFENVEFRGLSHFTEVEVRDLLDLRPGQRASLFTAEPQAWLLETRYRQKGFLYADVSVRTDPAARTLTFAVNEGPRVRVGGLRFIGNESFPARSFLGLRRNLVGSANLTTRPGFLTSPPFTEEALDEDLEKLRAFYRSNGFRDARVHVSDLIPSEDRRYMDVHILVEEGPRYVVSEVDLILEPGGGRPEPEFDREEVMGVLELKPGQHYSRQLIARDINALERFYGVRGFPSARRHPGLHRADDPFLFEVMAPLEIYHETDPSVKVVYRLKEGTRMRVRDVKISGNRGTRDAVVRRAISVYPGEILDSLELERSRGRLDALQYFDTIEGLHGANVRLARADEPDEVDVIVEVEEGRTGSLMWGLSYSSNHGLFGNVSYSKLNFDLSRPPTGVNPFGWIKQILGDDVFHGGGQTLVAEVQPGFLGFRGRVSFHEPDLFGDHIDTIGLRADLNRSFRRWETYNADLVGGMLTLDRRFGRDTSVTLSGRHETVELRRLSLDAPRIVWDHEGSTEIRALRLGLSHQDLDNLFQPTSGFTVSSYGEYGGGLLGGGVDFLKGGLQGEIYTPLMRDARDRAYVFHLSSRFDVVSAFGDSEDVHPQERFYMGGQGTVRGFSFRGAGPSQFGNPVGGRAMWLGTMEIQFPLFSVRQETRETDIIRGVVFTDAGLLGLSLRDEGFRDLRMSAGLGIRILVPGLGWPLAFDFPRTILFEDTDDRVFFHFRLGLR